MTAAAPELTATNWPLFRRLQPLSASAKAALLLATAALLIKPSFLLR